MRTRLCGLLGIEHTILNAPMAVLAGAPLAAAASGSRGLGLIGGAFREPDGLRAQIRAARDLTDRPVGVGFISHLAELTCWPLWRWTKDPGGRPLVRRPDSVRGASA